MLSTKELSILVGLKPVTIRKMAKELLKVFIAERLSSGWVFCDSAVDYINNRPEKRGRKRKKTE